MMLGDVGRSLTMIKNVGGCWTMLGWFGHPSQQNHVRASAERKKLDTLICFGREAANATYIR